MGSTRRAGKTSIWAAALVAVALMVPAMVFAAQGDLTATNKISVAAGLDGVQDIKQTPDGKFVYAVSFGDKSLVAMDRNSADGKLSLIAGDAVQTEGFDGVTGLLGANALAISPDGKNIYVAAEASDAVSMFSRNVTTGATNHLGNRSDSEPGFVALNGVNDIAVSPDGTSVYATSTLEDALTGFKRNAGTGILTYQDLEVDGLNNVDGLDEANGVVVSPDGKNVYTTARNESALTTFTRAADGTVAFLERDESLEDMLGLRTLAISPDGKFVYVYADIDHAIVVFSRNAATGALTRTSSFVDVNTIGSAGNLDISPDGKQLYIATGSNGNGIATFSRNATTGALALSQNKEDVDGLKFSTGVLATADGKHVYVGGQFDHAIVTFDRERAGSGGGGGGNGGGQGGGADKLILKVSGKARQKAGGLTVKVRCSNACKVTAKANGKADGDKFSSLKATRKLSAGKTVSLRIKLRKNVLKRVAGDKGNATIAVTATGGGDKSVKKFHLKLKR